jgi:hypothetical protein
MGRQLARSGLAAGLRLAMGGPTVPAPERVHVLHPEVTGIGADGMNGLLENAVKTPV